MRRGVGCRAGIAVAFVPGPDPWLAISASAGVLCNANTRLCSTRFRSIWAVHLGRCPEIPYADAKLSPGAVCSLRKGVWSVRDVDVVVQNMKSREDEHNIDPHASDLAPEDPDLTPVLNGFTNIITTELFRGDRHVELNKATVLDDPLKVMMSQQSAMYTSNKSLHGPASRSK